MRRCTHTARVPAGAFQAFCITGDAHLLVPVEPVGADAAPAIQRKRGACPSNRRAVVARIVRQEHPISSVTRRAERRVERARHARLVARCW